MAPVEQQQLTVPGTAQPVAPQQQPGSISLSTLIDFIIQRTYHDLNVLSELLPRKTDMERKIEIVQFASRTRQLFVRLLALVKWANSASKVDKCGIISTILDQQAMLFVQTADALANLSRETLVQARLPMFSIPSAIDVLTMGTYPRLPTCIKEKIVPPDPITLDEKRQTLMRLNQIIEHRLVTTQLPKHMRKLKIENGRVKFFVDHEFHATLTLMGEGPTVPWRLLDIDIMVEDPQTGGGKALVHSLQIGYIHQLVQSRLIDNEKPLHDLYDCLHSFCQSLQLEVLHSQIHWLVKERLGEQVRVEEYTAGKSLVVSYWRDLLGKEGKYFPMSVYKLSIHIDESDPSKPLQVTHFPQIQGSESIRVSQAIRSDHLSMERLLMQTLQVRSAARLKDLEREVQLYIKGQCKVTGMPPVLYIPVLEPCLLSEMLCVSVDILKGFFIVSLAQEETPLTREIEDSLNSERPELRHMLTKVRVLLGCCRCEKSVQQLPAYCSRVAPVVNLDQHALAKLQPERVFIKIPKQNQYCLVVEPKENSDRMLSYYFHLLHVTPSPCDDTFGEVSEDSQELFMTAGHMVQLDTFSGLHGPSSTLFDFDEEEPNPLIRKRRLLCGDKSEPLNKKPRSASYLVPELTHMVAMCEDRIPFMHLAKELTRQGINHLDVQVEGDNSSLSLAILRLPPCKTISKEVQDSLDDCLLACTVRQQKKPARMWLVELQLTHCPVTSTASKVQGEVQRILFTYDLSTTDNMEKIVNSLLEDWNSLSVLYSVVKEFASVFYSSNWSRQSSLEVRAYTYKRFTLAYGPNMAFMTSIQWRAGEEKFMLSFGVCGKSTCPNPHTLTASQLLRELNKHKSLVRLAQDLVDTWSPLSAVAKLSPLPLVGVTQRPGQPTPSFTVIPQSSRHVRVVFRQNNCIDIHCLDHNIVSVRDGAYSKFDTSKVVDKFMPTAALKAFLGLYVDESVTSHMQRRSTTEDDNPPSPVGMDTLDGFMAPQASISSPAAASRAAKADATLRFSGPSPLTPPSNPNTPASPSTRMSQPGVSPSPSATLMGAPSPANLLTGGSPGVLEGGGSPFPGGSNLAMPSPVARTWPPSPSLPGPSPASRHGMVHSPGHSALHSPAPVSSQPARMLPQRAWAASIPTLLSHDAMNKLMTPATLPDSPWPPRPPLERFLCSVYLKRNIQRLVQAENALHVVTSGVEPGVIQFRSETLQLRVALNQVSMQCLTLKVASVPEHDRWSQEELEILEKFFEAKVVCPPYRANNLTSFIRLLTAPTKVLKDLVQLMRLELFPERSMKWSLQWCLTMPPEAPPLAPHGTSAFVIRTTKIMFHIQLIRVATQPGSGDPYSVVLPILFEMGTNITSVPDLSSHLPSSSPVGQAVTAIQAMLRRFAEYNHKPNECSIYPALWEVLSHNS